MIRTAIRLLREKGPVSFAALARSTAADTSRRWVLSMRHNTSIHPSARIDAGVTAGMNGTISIGANSTLARCVVLDPSGGDINIGSNTLLNAFTAVLGHGGILIGDDVLIGPQTTIVAANHGHSRTDVPMVDQSLSTEGIEIADDVWIGANCTILDGVQVGSGALIAAGSVVTEDVAGGTIVAGAPAEVIATRQR